MNNKEKWRKKGNMENSATGRKCSSSSGRDRNSSKTRILNALPYNGGIFRAHSFARTTRDARPGHGTRFPGTSMTISPPPIYDAADATRSKLSDQCCSTVQMKKHEKLKFNSRPNAMPPNLRTRPQMISMHQELLPSAVTQTKNIFFPEMATNKTTMSEKNNMLSTTSVLY